MNRYFLALSYLGSNFKASAKVNQFADLTTVAGAIETAASSFNYLKRISPVYLSSRTDAGVHALYNTAHTDFGWERNECINIEHLKKDFNKYFCQKNLALRILDIVHVSSDFSARYCAKKRVYIYRIAVNKNCISDAVTPITEWGRCHFVLANNSFDLNALKETLLLFPGIKDFTSFTKKPSKQTRSPIRFLHSCEISKGKSLISPLYDSVVDNYSFWDISFVGASFTYGQVLRMTTASLAVAVGKLTVAEVSHMLTSPSNKSWPCDLLIAPSCGLYLVKVLYDPEDFSINRISRPHPYLHLLNIIDQHKAQLKLSSAK